MINEGIGHSSLSPERDRSKGTRLNRNEEESIRLAGWRFDCESCATRLA
jgi:hypothetical protein